MTASPDYISKRQLRSSNLLLFAAYWVVLFILYLPAANAGRVGDFPGWVTFLNANNFIDYINRKGSGIPSLYQFTQAVTWCFYRLFGANAWLWHLLYLTLQALNAFLLYSFFNKLFSRAHVNNANIAAFTGAMLFSVSPYISEVVVWEPSFHYLLGLLLMLIVLICSQNYLITQRIKFAWLGGIVFFLSSYSLEVFYLTPLFVFSLALFYRVVPGVEQKTVKNLIIYFTIPQVLIFLLHLIILRIWYHSGIAHVGNVALQVNNINLSKSLKYLFHIVFLGRFFPGIIRARVYQFSETAAGLWLFYGLLLITVLFLISRYRRMGAQSLTIVLLAAWVGCSLGLILPLWFPDTGVVIYDRYTYVLDAFLFMFLSLIIGSFCNRTAFFIIVSIYSLVNIRFTHKVNTYWQQSAHIVNNLVATFPNDPTKKVLLLNLPECLVGVQMVGTRDDGEFRMMYNSIRPDKITNLVYDVEAFYMSSPGDGAHVNVVNDSTMKVILNQWGTWWLYYGYGATNYENADYKVIMRDQGHWYDLVLKHPANEYLILYTVADKWNKVDWNIKGADQN